MKKIIAIATALLVTSGYIFAQLPQIKGAEALLNQVPPDIVGAKKSIDKAATISGAESLAYFWLIKSSTYAASLTRLKIPRLFARVIQTESVMRSCADKESMLSKLTLVTVMLEPFHIF